MLSYESLLLVLIVPFFVVVCVGAKVLYLRRGWLDEGGREEGWKGNRWRVKKKREERGTRKWQEQSCCCCLFVWTFFCVDFFFFFFLSGPQRKEGGQGSEGVAEHSHNSFVAVCHALPFHFSHSIHPPLKHTYKDKDTYNGRNSCNEPPRINLIPHGPRQRRKRGPCIVI